MFAKAKKNPVVPEMCWRDMVKFEESVEKLA